ncbi:anaerobic ribonucleoside triphosphate reductase [Proteocatella sphenisci]|uniref:anaerobic ribonucleoside triphosphate reductase n=1 Tax=Proteocatella sphenisci TaxID=181070 RepID=UPI000491FA80|nr:anaerobic ribonucleoside triphosphate reductase [Proteocatella sphenisci]
MFQKIIKRDGRTVEFNIERIATAIYKSAKAVGGQDYHTSMELSKDVVSYLSKKDIKLPSVEEIQDAVEKTLIETGHAKTAKEYILYRAERTRIREKNTHLMKIYEGLTFKDSSENDTKRENANIDGDTAMGTMLKYGSEGAKQFYTTHVLNRSHSNAHENGDIHIHDLDFLTLTTTCCQIDLEKLFAKGFSTGHGFLREPNDISSYSALTCIAIQSNQNDQHGGQSIPNFDYALSKGVSKTYARLYRQNLEKAIMLLCEFDDAEIFVKNMMSDIKNKFNLVPELSADSAYQDKEAEFLKENFGTVNALKIQDFVLKKALAETDRACYQAMESLVHNLNTMHSRAGAQIPFSSINYGMDTSSEGRMIIKNILLATEKGLGNEETPIFPIHIFKVKEGINYNSSDPNYDLFKLACRVSAKRLFPNFSFIDASFNASFYKGTPETEVAYMGCRTRVMANKYDPSREIVSGRGNLSFTSVNLPRIAIKNERNIEDFFYELDIKTELVIDQLLERFEIQCNKKSKNFPFLMGQGIWLDSDKLKPEDSIREVIRHGTLTVGFIGLAEALKALTGSHHGESADAQELGLKIISRMREKTDEAAKRYKLNFSLIATPAEGLSGRFVRMDRKKYGEIPGVTDREYYTNSFHIPVHYNITAFDKIRLEAPYHELTNGGHITYVEMNGDPSNNLEAFESVIKAMKEAGIGYGSINHPVDRDPECGYTGVIGEVCPKCKRSESADIPFERIRRITGYLVGTVNRFNDAKKAEESQRVKHMDASSERKMEIL